MWDYIFAYRPTSSISAIFRTRMSLIIFKKTIYIYKCVRRWVNDILLPPRKYGELGRDEQNIFCSGFNASTLFSKSGKEIFTVQET